MAFPDYTISTDTNGTLHESDLHAEIVAAGPYTSNFIGINASVAGDSLTVVFDESPSGPNIATIVTVLSNHGGALPSAKLAKYVAIDVRTRELIEEGFEYPASSGDYFSLSHAAQDSLMELNAIRDESGVLPLDWNHKDDQGKLTIADSTAARAFIVAAFKALRAHIDGGTTLKESTRAAATVGEVDDVVDTR